MAWSDVENTSGKKEKIPYTKFPEGGTRIRILDGEPYSFWQHWFPKQNIPHIDMRYVFGIIRQTRWRL